ncbi:type VI secretion system baseplate subunit TssE [Bordetella hinzii]|nr:type VI secretion system baseplate subunit TssE [Bordetella hinzii]QDJ41052.1 hypothetical protein CBR70_06920 [Bordetella hinzii]QDJ45605.1 hypothetical protein CBR71_07140 [Bordetella hinzii]QDJ54525.1 hypothetical protein CBR72_06640 [Bordetella hinzii]
MRPWAGTSLPTSRFDGVRQAVSRYFLPLLDRLSADAPDPVGQEALHASLVRELERLFTTRSSRPLESDMAPDDGWEAYGIPDFSSQMLRSQNEREAIEARVAQAVRRYEPRLADVEVVFSFPDDDVRRGHFVVSGRLIAQSQAPHVRFEIALSTVA